MLDVCACANLPTQLKWGGDNDNGSAITEWVLLGTPGDGRAVDHAPPPGMAALVELYRGADTSYQHNKLRPGRTFEFRVRAVNGIGPSDWSDVSSLSTPGTVW